MDLNWDDVKTKTAIVSTPGWHLCRVDTVEQTTTSKKGLAQWQIDFVVMDESSAEDGHSIRDWLTLTSAAMWRMKQLYTALGISTTGRATIHPDDIAGRDCWVGLEYKPDTYGEQKLKVAANGYRSVSQGAGPAPNPAAAPEPEKSGPITEDEIPF